MGKKVIIPEQVSAYVERLFFEYNASLNIIRYLMSQDDIKEEYMQRYLRRSEQKYTELEMVKENIAIEYAPVEFSKYNYTFDFEHNTIVYAGVWLIWVK